MDSWFFRWLKLFYCRYELEFSICFWMLKRPPKRDKNSNSSHDFERCLLKTFNCLPSSTNSRITCLRQFLFYLVSLIDLHLKKLSLSFLLTVHLILPVHIKITVNNWVYSGSSFLLSFRKICFLIINSYAVGMAVARPYGFEIDFLREPNF